MLKPGDVCDLQLESDGPLAVLKGEGQRKRGRKPIDPDNDGVLDMDDLESTTTGILE